MPAKKTKVGIIGCGNISGIYFQAGKTFENLEIVACADMNMDAAKAKGEEHKVKACTVDELLANPEIEIVINLTIPAAHYEVALKALKAGKSAYTEKPLALTIDQGKELDALAKAKGLRLGCAPDTFMGGGLQTCRKLLDDGWIGQPIAATAFMLGHGMEMWHPNPDSFYQVGGGPMFDIGPYYLTALVNMLGPVKRIAGATKTTFAERLITSQPRFGQKVKVDTPTHVTGVLDFTGGAVATVITSFDVWHHQLPRIEIYGTEGTLSLPDPNGFGGPVKIRSASAKEWSEVPLTHSYTGNSRGIGVADMASAAQSGRPHRANGEMALHVLECMHAFLESSKQEKHFQLQTTCSRPAPLPMGLREGTID